MDVKRAVTNEQKEKVLEIPDVFSKNDNYYFDDEDTDQVSAILNNVAGTVNVDAEKLKGKIFNLVTNGLTSGK